MALTYDAREVFVERARKSRRYRIAILGEVLECIADGEANTARDLLRDYVQAVGSKKVARLVCKEPQAVMRMLRPSSNPSLDNISKLLASLRKHEGVEPRVRVG